jgi:heme-degrading monooxygenase HmoA
MVSLTRLRLRSWWYLPQFLWMNERSVNQLRRAPGFLGARLLLDRGRVFWTMSLWQDEASMRAFRDTGPHRPAMAKLKDWCDQASVARLDGRTELPGWQEAHALMLAYGRPSRVRHPAPEHDTLTFPMPRTSADRPVSPSSNRHGRA